MRYLSCFLGFSLLILTYQTSLLLFAQPESLPSTSSDHLVDQNYSSANSSGGDSSSPPKGSDRRDS